MATKTKIEWTDYSWNPVTGCTEADTSCRNCYARRMAARLAGRNGYPADEPFRVTLHPDRLDEPLRWRKPRRVFVCSMGDLFHKDVPFDFILKVFAVAIATPWNTYLMLTKRPDRAHDFYDWWRTEAAKLRYLCLQVGMAMDAQRMAESALSKANTFYLEHCDQSGRGRLDDPVPWPLANVWLGASAGRQKELDDRLAHLLRCPAAVRFLSLEPLLGPIDLGEAHVKACPVRGAGKHVCPNVDWVIVGGESGPNARPCNVAWVRSIRDQCKAAGVPVFVKQLGAKPQTNRGQGWPDMSRLQIASMDQPLAWPLRDVHLDDPKGGDESEWPEDLRVREVPKCASRA